MLSRKERLWPVDPWSFPSPGGTSARDTRFLSGMVGMKSTDAMVRRRLKVRRSACSPAEVVVGAAQIPQQHLLEVWVGEELSEQFTVLLVPVEEKVLDFLL